MSDERLIISREYCDGVGDGLRYAYGGEDEYYPSQWENAIKGLKKTLQAKTATPGASQQVIEPDSGYDGLTAVTVSGDADLVAGNIKKDVEIFGVTGTYEGGGGAGGRVTQDSSGMLTLSEDGSIVAEVPLSVAQNGNYIPSSGYAYSEVEVDVSGGSATLTTKTITANGTYNASSDNADGYSQVVANVPNTYAAGDEGKVVSSGALVAQTSKNISANGTYTTTTNNQVAVAVPNTYASEDEGKVVSNGALVSQTSKNINSNGTHSTTTNNQVVVAVPNTYAAGDEGKVVSSGALVSQSSLSVNSNGTYDTTLKNSVVVNVQSSGVNIPLSLAVTTQPTKTTYAGGEYLDLSGIVVTATFADGTTADVTSSCTFSPEQWTILTTQGTQSITATYNKVSTIPGETYVVTVKAYTSVTVTSDASSWTTGTDEEVAALIDAARQGTIDLQQDAGWAVGDKRTIHIESFNGDRETQPAQDVDIVITQFGDYMNCGCLFQFDLVQTLLYTMYISSKTDNVNGYGVTSMYLNTLNHMGSALPQWLKDRMKTFSVLSSAGGQSANIRTETNNKLALRSEVEVFGANTYSAAGEGSQIEYYRTAANRIKPIRKTEMNYGGTWWLRSPNVNRTDSFCSVYTDGTTEYRFVSGKAGVAPFGCI